VAGAGDVTESSERKVRFSMKTKGQVQSRAVTGNP
jgi:hypothetical protein